MNRRIVCQTWGWDVQISVPLVLLDNLRKHSIHCSYTTFRCSIRLGGYNSSHLVKWSTMIKKHRNPWELRGYSTISNVTSSPGGQATIGWSGAVLVGTGFVFLWNGKRFVHQSSSDIDGQKNFSLTLVEVLAVPKWPKSSIVHHLTSYWCTISRDGYLPCTWGVLSSSVPKDAILPNS